jgi:hypothetical protein
VKKNLLAAVASVFIVTAGASRALAQSPQIYAPDGTYLGNLNSNRFDPNSVANPFGRYGSPFSPDSVTNPFGRYGSPFSPDSPNNPFAVGAPPINENDDE